MPRMKSFDSFAAYLAAQPPKSRAIIKALRAFVRTAEPQLIESVKWGNGCWLADKEPIAYVYADDGFVQFGLILGSKLRDPRHLLEGNGRFVRHVKVSAVSKIDRRALAALLHQAVRLRRPIKRGATKKKRATRSAALRKRA